MKEDKYWTNVGHKWDKFQLLLIDWLHMQMDLSVIDAVKGQGESTD